MDPVSVRGVNQDPVFRYYRTGMDSREIFAWSADQPHTFVTAVTMEQHILKYEFHILKVLKFIEIY